MTRDLTKAQFLAALKRNGMRPSWGGYVAVLQYQDGGAKAEVYGPNAGRRRRDQLAYLLRERDRILDRESQR